MPRPGGPCAVIGRMRRNGRGITDLGRHEQIFDVADAGSAVPDLNVHRRT
ncbi:MAG: hypothetical protein H6926_07060 [Chromatiales bacterium]|nr:hypothetical protein [Chromatiales bacterium]